MPGPAASRTSLRASLLLARVDARAGPLRGLHASNAALAALRERLSSATRAARDHGGGRRYDLADRSAASRMACRSGLDLVPAGRRGAHGDAVVPLVDLDLLARRLGLGRLGSAAWARPASRLRRRRRRGLTASPRFASAPWPCSAGLLAAILPTPPIFAVRRAEEGEAKNRPARPSNGARRDQLVEPVRVATFARERDQPLRDIGAKDRSPPVGDTRRPATASAAR